MDSAIRLYKLHTQLDALVLQASSLETIASKRKPLITFSNQVIKDVDLSEELYGEVFEPLRDVQLFKQAYLNSETNTIEWPNGADFAPEFLYDLGQPIPRTA